MKQPGGSLENSASLFFDKPTHRDVLEIVRVEWLLINHRFWRRIQKQQIDYS